MTASAQLSQQLALLAATLQKGADQLSLDQSVMKDVITKVMIISLKYVNQEEVWSILFKDHFVDWDIAGTWVMGNILGDTHVWVPLLELCRWEKGHYDDHPPLNALRKCMIKHGLDDGEWTMPCQLLLLQLLRGIPTMQAFEILTCRRLKRDTHQNCALLLAHLSDTMYTPDVYVKTLTALLDPNVLTIDTDQLESHAKISRRNRDDVAKALTMRIHLSNVGRPRLRDRLQKTAEENTTLDTLHGTWESYTSFCQLHQFPNVLSETMKMKTYFLASQKTWPWGETHIFQIVKSTSLSEHVAKYPVSKPDLTILHRCINALGMDGSPPFQEMIDFKCTCFKNFPVVHIQRITLGQVLRLYVCAYQNPTIWKELWKMQVSLLSPQIIRDCELFVKEHPFADAAFMNIFHKSAG